MADNFKTIEREHMGGWNSILFWNVRSSISTLIKCQNADGKTLQENWEVAQIGLVIH